ncbi:hypothetical protein SAMN05216503_2676 [Polaribacter sp. KT25b]|uniref:hypothetical protein n=1 Tax=Polaribacter sp. KT25b TaxID=1855336 RepID=UPI00087D5AAF|nr:hypothetical protein [Polaribacter sp. KT25b]SDS31835.1 hypothetical protein SAMN05216503_2676 [Polaribacter sp. KT25b]
MASLLGAILYYMYTFGEIYKLSIVRSILKLFRFLIGLISPFIFSLILVALTGVIIGFWGLVNF